MKYIYENLSEPLTLGDTAHKFGFSAEYFCTLFKQYAGI